MPYIARRLIQRPYQPNPYIQQGGGFFSSFFDNVKNTVFPWMMRMGKTTASDLGRAAKSKAAQNITSKAKKAVEDSLKEAGAKIVQGHNIGQVIKEGADKTKNKVIQAVKDTAADQFSDNNTKPNTRKRKAGPLKTRAKASKIGKKAKGFTLI